MTLCRSITLFQFGSYRTQLCLVCYPRNQGFSDEIAAIAYEVKICAGNMYFGGSASS
jgi:hypothetical protein